MARPKAIKLLEDIYVHTDKQIRDIMGDPVSLRPISVHFTFAGGGAVLNPLTADPIKLELPLANWRLVKAHLYAMDGTGELVIVTLATVDIRLSTFSVDPVGSTPLYGGTIPTLAAVAVADLDITDWQQYLAPNSVLTAKLGTPLTGVPTVITLVLHFAPVDSTRLVLVTDSTGDTMTFNDGDPMTFGTGE